MVYSSDGHGGSVGVTARVQSFSSAPTVVMTEAFDARALTIHASFQPSTLIIKHAWPARQHSVDAILGQDHDVIALGTGHSASGIQQQVLNIGYL